VLANGEEGSGVRGDGAGGGDGTTPDGEEAEFLKVDETGLLCCHGRVLLAGGVEGELSPDISVRRREKINVYSPTRSQDNHKCQLERRQ